MERDPPAENDPFANFIQALEALPGAQASLRTDDPATAHLSLPCETRCTLRLEAKRHVYPRDARELLWRLAAARDGLDDDVHPVVVAESVSVGAKALLRDNQVGYYDTGGSLFLCHRGIYVHIDKPPPKALSSRERSLFSGHRARAVLALLLDPQHPFGATELAERSAVSVPTASVVLVELERHAWVATTGRGPRKKRRLADPRALLDAWVAHLPSLRAPTARHYYVPFVGVDELARRLGTVLDQHGLEHALTHEVAAQRYAPFLSSLSRVYCTVPLRPSRIPAMRELGARRVDDGANLTILVAPVGSTLFRQRVDGQWLASPIEVYLDLLRDTRRRAADLAEHLRQECIGF